MPDLIQPKLVNEPFSDPVLFLDFRFRRRALLFDLGYLTPLSTREIVRVSHVFVSHMHMDHFAGFDRLLRSVLYQPVSLHLTGPPGIGDAVEAKLKAYTWNLLGAHSTDLSLSVADWTPAGFVRQSLFRARRAFAREETEPPQTAAGILLDDPEFLVEGAMLDHGIPSLAFAFQEKMRVNVHKPRLDELGLAVGPWLTKAKHLVRRGDPPETEITVGDRQVSLDELTEADALNIGPGQRIAYATDLAHTPENVAAAVNLARNADRLYIEAGYLDQDRELAASRRHLTAAQAGDIARSAGVARAFPMHFSARYLEKEDELRREFEEHFTGQAVVEAGTNHKV
ncbi:MBL fold metallo-hydrolase [Mesorhizobium sp. BAC0120]|uniref:ribonuclease Z n=1 Tax=Mesorhizobium sp. BAC0120 TaxID=3090670 RepID=UPI00298D36E1|nr:MBL fold metallo-hydrolase [Mesorhizobium sp. BAC0120]MDW6025245.1 MBL fold metallo-hydrolase [Mesorhizobium sp. BAC0120]